MNLPKPMFEERPAVDVDTLPDTVKLAICRWERKRELPLDSVINVLQYDGMNRCYCFAWAGMYVGVETDGNPLLSVFYAIHT